MLGFIFAMNYPILSLLIDPIRPYLGGGRLRYLSPMDPFFVTLKLAFLIGFSISIPILLYNLAAIVSPLLRPAERRLLRPAAIAAVLLFAGGAAFCYALVLPLMLRFTMGFQAGSLEQSVVIGEYLKIVLRLMLAFGTAFQLPIVVLIGTLLGLVTPSWLASKRRHAIAVIVVVSAIITPPDLTSQLLLAVPVWVLYELSIILSRAVLARRASAAAALEA